MQSSRERHERVITTRLATLLHGVAQPPLPGRAIRGAPSRTEPASGEYRYHQRVHVYTYACILFYGYTNQMLLGVTPTLE
jgi:hypothetical protein